MQDLGAKARHFQGLIIIERAESIPAVKHPGVAGQNAVNIGPNLNLIRGYPGANQRSRQI
jgi:hypothetical protein